MTRATAVPETVTIHVPFRVVKRGGRKEMQMPEGATQQQRMDNTLVKALARAFRWKRMLESGEFATIAELAEREGIAPSYMTRILRLTQLEPAIIEAVLEGRQGGDVTLARAYISSSATTKTFKTDSLHTSASPKASALACRITTQMRPGETPRVSGSIL